MTEKVSCYTYFGGYPAHIEGGLVTLPLQILQVVKKRNGEDNTFYVAPFTHRRERCLVYYDGVWYENLGRILLDREFELVSDPRLVARLRIMLSDTKQVELKQNKIEVPMDLVTIIKNTNSPLLLGVGLWFELWHPKQYERWSKRWRRAKNYQKLVEGVPLTL